MCFRFKSSRFETVFRRWSAVDSMALMSRSRSAWALVLTSVAFFMGALDSLVVITALPAVHKEIGGSLSSLEWTLNAYTVAVAAGIITAAAIGDRLGARRAGRRRGDHDATQPHHPDERISCGAPGRDHRRVGRDRRPGHRHWTHDRWGGDAGPQLALDLLGQRSNWHRGGAALRHPFAGEPRRADEARHPRSRARDGRGYLLAVGSDPLDRRWLDRE